MIDAKRYAAACMSTIIDLRREEVCIDIIRYRITGGIYAASAAIGYLTLMDDGSCQLL